MQRNAIFDGELWLSRWREAGKKPREHADGHCIPSPQTPVADPLPESPDLPVWAALFLLIHLSKPQSILLLLPAASFCRQSIKLKGFSSGAELLFYRKCPGEVSGFPITYFSSSESNRPNSAGRLFVSRAFGSFTRKAHSVTLSVISSLMILTRRTH